MKCMDVGTLQGYLDNELPEARTRCAAGHLELCAACRDRLERLAATAGRVDAWLGALAPEDLPALDAVVPPIAPKAAGMPWRWAGMALAGALAASVVFFFANPRPIPKLAAHALEPQAPAAKARNAASVTPRRAAMVRAAAVRKRFPAGPPATHPALDDFVLFDDADPLQIGMVVRVMVPVSGVSLNGGAQEIAADLMIGEDGRARAIRVLP